MIKPNTVMVIGDRQVGKTNTIIALKDPGTCHVQISNDLSGHYDPETGEIAGTYQRTQNTLEMIIELPLNRKKQLYVKWIDTPGERWENIKEWRENHPEDWRATKQMMIESEAIFLILPPYRELITPKFFRKYAEPYEKIDDFPTMIQWRNSLNTWFDFFKQNCHQVSHLLISIHKADFFCDLETESRKYCACNYNLSVLFQSQTQIREQYFYPIGDLIREYNSQKMGQEVQFFITTKNNKCMLEVPWLYLAAYFKERDY